MRKNIWGLGSGVWAILAAFCLLPSAFAGDITKGYAFTSGEHNVTHTKLNNLVDLATIETTFYTGKSATTDPAANDVMLLYSAALADYRKVTINSLLYGNTELITGQTEDTSPASGDFLLTYDLSTTSFRKVQLGNLGSTVTNIIAGNLPAAGVGPGALILIYQGGTNATAVLSNALQQFSFAHLAAHTTPTNDDKLLIWSSVNASNRSTTLIGLTTNLTVATGLNTNSLISVVTTNNTGTNIVAQATLLQLNQTLTAIPGARGQIVSASTNEYKVISSVIAYDDSIPQNTEGSNILSVAITPRSASSKLLIQAEAHGELTDNACHAIMALFQDSTADALAASATVDSSDSTGEQTLRLMHVMTSGTTSATTFSLRIGVDNNAFDLNGNGARKLGGAQAAWLTVQEIGP